MTVCKAQIGQRSGIMGMWKKASNNSPRHLLGGHTIAGQNCTTPDYTPIPSIVFDEGCQTFGVADVSALKEDNVFISEISQANEPNCAAIAELRAKPWLGVILQNYDSRLVLRQFHGLCQNLVAILLARGGWLQHLAGPALQRFNN